MNQGRIALFGSGETSRRGRQVHAELLRAFAAPVTIAILETPAGFQPNVSVVSRKLREFFEHSLQNFEPRVQIVAARHRGGIFDPDAPDIVAPLLHADYIFAGPGSPTYTVRQLRGTLALDILCARHDAGATLTFASAAAIAFGRFCLPVYEIYKAGDDLHWQPGLNLFQRIGLDLTIMPHWNNTEGGSELDTSHCFVGQDRFRYLKRMLPPETTVLGIDEHTACVLDPDAQTGTVHGAGGVTILRGPDQTFIAAGKTFPFSALRARTPAVESTIASSS